MYQQRTDYPLSLLVFGIWLRMCYKVCCKLLVHRIESDSLDDGHGYTPSSIFSWLTRYMYNRRTKIDPLWNTVVVGGYYDNTP